MEREPGVVPDVGYGAEVAPGLGTAEVVLVTSERPLDAPPGHLPLDELEVADQSPVLRDFGQVTREFVKGIHIDPVSGIRFASTNRWAAELGVVRQTVKRTVEGRSPFAVGVFAGKTVLFWDETTLQPLFERNFTPPPGYGEVIYVAEYNGVPVNERVGTSKAWQRAGYGQFLYRISADAQPLAVVRYSDQDLAIWTESQVLMALKTWEEARREQFHGGVQTYFSDSSLLYGSATAWSLQHGQSHSAPLRTALQSVAAESRAIPRTQAGATVELYSEHAVAAAQAWVERRAELSTQLQIDPESYAVLGTVDAWRLTVGRDQALLWKALKPFMATPAKSVVTRGEPSRPLFSFEQLAAVAPSGWFQQPVWRCAGGQRLVLPDGAVYRRLQWSQADKWRPVLRSVTVLNHSNQLATYYAEVDVEAAGGQPLPPLLPEERDAYQVSQNPYHSRLRALEQLRVRAAELKQVGVTELTDHGYVVQAGRTLAPRSVLLQLARERGIDTAALERQLASCVPVNQQVVRWRGHWRQPLFLDLFDIEEVLKVPSVMILPPAEPLPIRPVAVLDEVAAWYGITRAELTNPYNIAGRRRTIRGVAARLLREELQLSSGRVARVINELGQAGGVRVAIQEINARVKRDEEFKAELTALRERIRSLPSAVAHLKEE